MENKNAVVLLCFIFQWFPLFLTLCFVIFVCFIDFHDFTRVWGPWPIKLVSMQ